MFTLNYSKAKQEADKGIPLNDRVFSIIFFLLAGAMLLFLINHQLQNTGFYTKEFGIIEKIMLYGFWIMWFITAGLEGILGKRFLSRIFDSFGGIIFASIACLWILIIFPFEFNFFSILLPDSMQWIFKWITNDIAKIILLLSFLLHTFAIFFAPVAYKFITIKKTSRK